MAAPTSLYNDSLGLLTDLYQLTMAYGYWKSGVADREAVFHLSFRSHPFDGGYTIACGLGLAIDYIENFHLDRSDLDYLAGLTDGRGAPLFEEGFLRYLEALRLTVDVDAVEEGRVVFPHEPLVRVRGPVLQAQLLETPLLNMLNFQTLIATKAARVCQAARGEPVLEFGLRRAQGIDGGVAVARAAYVGGVAATSNLLAGKLFGIPVRGTHAHSWVMFFGDELEAFERYAEALPGNCVFLVDTYDSLEGTRRAIEVGRKLRERGHEMAGIRLDSGDLAYLSIEARRLLDEAGFPDAAIVASNNLDEHVIESLKKQGATIGVWGVGTRLATAYDDPALGGVYKMSAVRSEDGQRWEDRIKLSEQIAKITTPGILQVRRFTCDGEHVGDQIFDERTGADAPSVIVDLLDPTRRKLIGEDAVEEALLVPIFRGGTRCYDVPALDVARARAAAELSGFHPGVRRFLNPHAYPVGLEPRLHERRTRRILEARGFADAAGDRPD